ncbi:MAG: LamG domain-containing protein, partial [Sphingobacteriales bacterium]
TWSQNVWVDYQWSNRRTNFTTTAANVTIKSVDFHILPYQQVTGLVLSLYNSSGAVIATSSTSTSVTAGATAIRVTNIFNTNLATAGNYSVGISAGNGSIGYDDPSFPLTEATGTINLTGTTSQGNRCFNNIQFSRIGSAIAPTPSTAEPGSYTHTVTQTVNGQKSAPASINVVVTANPSATIAYTGAPFCSSSTPVAVTRTGTTGGTFTASPAGLSINASTGQITPAASTAGTYTVTYTIAASGGCSQYTTTASVTITQAPDAAISYSGSPFCVAGGTKTVTRTGTAGGTYSAPGGLDINASTGAINLNNSATGTYTITYTIAAAGGCPVYTTTTSITVSSPDISQLPATGLQSYYPMTGNANDIEGTNTGTLQNAPVAVTNRFGVAASAYQLNGTSQYISTTNSYSNPSNFTISIWFKTNSTTGGKLIGFGSSRTGASGQYDRHIYMNNSGQIYFGVYPGSAITVNSAAAYNDNQWHLATATLSSTLGMALYVDGALVGSNSNTKTAENYTGFWKIGYDNLNGWPSAPSSTFFKADLDDVLIYNAALTAGEVATLYASPDGAGNNGPVCAGSSLMLTATTIPGATYAWTGPNGFVSSLQNPSISFSAAAAGTYMVQVTSSGCSAKAYTNVISSTLEGQWTGNVDTDWANAANWCSGMVPTSSTDVVIAAGAVRMPVIISTGACRNLTINGSAVVAVAASGSLSIAGTLSNSGTYTDNGTTIFNGTGGQQTFNGVTTFNNLTLNNSNGLQVPVALTIKKDLTITQGVLS